MNLPHERKLAFKTIPVRCLGYTKALFFVVSISEYVHGTILTKKIITCGIHIARICLRTELSGPKYYATGPYWRKKRCLAKKWLCCRPFHSKVLFYREVRPVQADEACDHLTKRSAVRYGQSTSLRCAFHLLVQSSFAGFSVADRQSSVSKIDVAFGITVTFCLETIKPQKQSVLSSPAVFQEWHAWRQRRCWQCIFAVWQPIGAKWPHGRSSSRTGYAK